MRSIVLVILVMQFSWVNAQQKLKQKDLKKLYAMLIGNYSSQKQHLQDTANYYDIMLHMAPIWKDNTNGLWLYVEQAIASNQEKPYRQRVYQLSLINDSTILSKIFLLNQPLRFAGQWKNELPLHNITVDSLVYKQGCDVYLHKNGKKFVGGTVGKNCESIIRGANYATTVVTIESNKLTSWDRGYDKNDKQVWGATLGGYEFIKQ